MFGNHQIRKQSKLESLQFLRAISAIFVVFYHLREKEALLEFQSFQVLQWFSIGKYGVDMFFVISGFIIAYIEPPDAFSFSRMKNFIARRIIRIIPLYWTVSLLALAVWLVNPEVVNSTAPHLTRIWESFLLWPTDGRYLYQTGWTLRFEFLFYLLFAATMIFSRRQTIVLPLILLGAIAFEILTGDRQAMLAHDERYFLMEFLAGYLFCVHGKHLIGASAGWGLALVAAASAILISHNFGLSELAGQLYFWGIPAIMLVSGAVMMEGRVNLPKAMTTLGDQSYSLYLTHSFIVAAMAISWRRFMPEFPFGSIVFFAVSVVLILFVTHVTYHFYEMPITKALNRWWRRKRAGTVSYVHSG